MVLLVIGSYLMGHQVTSITNRYKEVKINLSNGDSYSQSEVENLLFNKGK